MATPPRIISADQAANLREIAERQAELDALIAEHTESWGCRGESMLERLDRDMDSVGEESQDPGDWASS